MAETAFFLPRPDPGETGPYALVGTARAKPGLADALEERLLSLVGPTRQEEGVRGYHLHRDRADPDTFVFYEVWSSRDALRAHLDQRHVAQFLATRHEVLSGDLQITWLKMSSPCAT